MNPFGMGISADIRAIQVKLRQIENIAVRILAGGHDARDHVRLVHIVGNAGHVLFLPDLYVRIIAHALYEKHIEPVPGQLRAVLFDHPAFAQQGFHGVDVLEAHFISSGGQVGIEGEIVLRKTA